MSVFTAVYRWWHGKPRSYQKRCKNCQEVIWWRDGMADSAGDRLRDHRKVCE